MTTQQGFVYVVDDDTSFRRSITRLLATVGYEVASFPSAIAFFAQHTTLSRGCVLADLHMPECDGLELQARLAGSTNPLPVVFLSGNGTIPSTVKAIKQGAVDFLTKCAPEVVLLDAIAKAIVLDGIQAERRIVISRMQGLYDQLSAREREVFAGVLGGNLNKQIAADLGIAMRTVKAHRTQISRKLRLASVPEWIELWNTIRAERI
jgi:two-component system, LuxR family, response regulator FixJ